MGDKTYRELPKYPAVERDLSLLVPLSVSYGAVARTILKRGGTHLEEVWPFDVYSGEWFPDGSRSIACRLRFRHSDRTLTDPEVEAAITELLVALEEELGVRRR